MILFSGKNSLEIYLLHGLLLNILKLNGEIYFNSVVGILTVLGNYLITVILCLFIIKILNNNRVLNKILWAKKIIFRGWIFASQSGNCRYGSI